MYRCSEYVHRPNSLDFMPTEQVPGILEKCKWVVKYKV